MPVINFRLRPMLPLRKGLGFFITGCCVLFALAACRTPKTELPIVSAAAVAREEQLQQTRFLEEDDARRERLHRVTFPLLREAVALFEEKPRPAMGIVLLTDEAYPERYQARARALWQIEDVPIIRHVAPDSPAARTGLQPNDRIRALNGTPVAEDPATFLDDLRAAMHPDEMLALTIQRKGIEETVTLSPAAIADYRVRLKYDAAVNARATGRAIEINRAMIDFCENDEELAFIVAHELAHNALRHHRDFAINYALGTAADLALLFAGVPTPNAVGLVNALWPSKAYESEADYLAVVLLQRTGYDPEKVLDFWPRLSALAPLPQRGPLFIGTHPDFAERQARLRLALEHLRPTNKE
jgi:hypothetical protein